MDIDLIEQAAVIIVCRINDAKDALQDSHIGKQFLSDAGQIEHQCHVADTICLHIVVYQFHAVCIHLLIIDRRCLAGDILSL